MNTTQPMNHIHKDHNEYDSPNKEDSAYETKTFGKCDSFNINEFNYLERNQTMKEIKEMNKNELVELTTTQLVDIQELNAIIDDRDQLIAELKLKLEASSKDGRKSQVLDLLRNHKTISILELSKTLNISTKNISSQLTYLRSDGYAIFTDPKGRKMLVEDQEVNETQETEDNEVTE